MKEEEKKEESKFKIDTINTILGNILWIFLMFIVIVFVILAFSKIDTLEPDTDRLLALIVFMFATIKILKWIGHPQISWIERKYLKGDK